MSRMEIVQDECVAHDRPLRYLLQGADSPPWILFHHDGRDWLTDRYACWDVDYPAEGFAMRSHLDGIAPPQDEGACVTVWLEFYGFGEFRFREHGDRSPLPRGLDFLQRGGIDVRLSRWCYLMGEKPVTACPRADGKTAWLSWELAKDALQTLPRDAAFEQDEEGLTSPIRVIDKGRVIGALSPQRWDHALNQSMLDLIRVGVGWPPA